MVISLLLLQHKMSKKVKVKVKDSERRETGRG